VVAVVAHEMIGLPWGPAFALGAIVSPPDAVAATTITRRLGIPQRIVTIVEGESLVNDATAIVAYRIAVTAVMTGLFSLSDALLRFVLVAAGGIAVGLAVGWVAGQLRRRVNDPPVQMTLSLLTPFAAYLPAEALQVSSVLAVVTTGLYIGGIRLLLSPATRLQAFAVWEVVIFLLNGLIFILIGLQLPGIMRELAVYPLARLVGWAALVSLTVIVVRFVWVFPTTYLSRALRRACEQNPYPFWRSVFVIAWTGMRGVVSLAAAFALPFALPSGAPFPDRNLILFLTFGVILVTLVLQGMMLPLILRWLGLADPDARQREEREARLRAGQAAMARLEELAADEGLERDHLDRLRWLYENRGRRLAVNSDPPEINENLSGGYERLRRDLITIERGVIRQLRDTGVISDDVMLRIDRDLDLEETRVEA
jgi:CPA1 family monovalent cation:H+ antiporter